MKAKNYWKTIKRKKKTPYKLFRKSRKQKIEKFDLCLIEMSAQVALFACSKCFSRHPFEELSTGQQLCKVSTTNMCLFISTDQCLCCGKKCVSKNNGIPVEERCFNGAIFLWCRSNKNSVNKSSTPYCFYFGIKNLKKKKKLVALSVFVQCDVDRENWFKFIELDYVSLS